MEDEIKSLRAINQTLKNLNLDWACELQSTQLKLEEKTKQVEELIPYLAENIRLKEELEEFKKKEDEEGL